MLVPLPPDVAEELVARPQGHRDGARQQHLADVEQDLAEDVQPAVDLAQRQAAGRRGRPPGAWS